MNWIDRAGAQVIAFRRPATMQDHTGLDRVEAYWDELRGGARRPPARTAIDPRRLDGALSGAFLIERIAPGLARLRIAGRDLSGLMGMDPRGMPLSALFLPEARDRLEGLVELLFEGPARLTLDLAVPGTLGTPRRRGRMLLLPLSDREGRINRALGALEIAPPPGRVPQRVAIAGCHSRPLADDTECAAAPPPVAPAPRLRRPHLTLVHCETVPGAPD